MEGLSKKTFSQNQETSIHKRKGNYNARDFIFNHYKTFAILYKHHGIKCIKNSELIIDEENTYMKYDKIQEVSNVKLCKTDAICRKGDHFIALNCPQTI